LQIQQRREIVSTVLLYLRGEIAQTKTGEACLVLSDGVRLSRRWLRQQLHRCTYAQQMRSHRQIEQAASL
jgi:hypothetical protein